MTAKLGGSHTWPARAMVALLFAASLMVALHSPVWAASCVVTSTADSGAGTLRQCLLNAGAGDVITFDPAVFPPGAPATIALTDPLPAITAGGVTIDAANAGVTLNGDGIDEGNADGLVLASSNNAIYGLHLHAFHGRGIVVQPGADNNQIGGVLPGQRNIIDWNGNGAIRILGNGNQVSGNWIGTEDGLTLPGVAGNAGNGIELAAGAQQNTIGGDQPGAGNVIVGSMENGVALYGTGVTSNTVAGNHIGVNAAGDAILANAGDGVWIGDGATANIVGGVTGGARNYITGNEGNGVSIEGQGSAFNTIAGNWIGLDVNGTQEVEAQVVVLSPHYAADQTLWVSALNSGIWQSTDGGGTWAQVNNGLTQLAVPALAISPAFVTDGTLFAGTTDGAIFKSTDGGGNWAEVYSGDLGRVNVLAVSPSYDTDGIVFAGAEGGLLRSIDRGATWIGQPGDLIYALAVSPAFGADHTVFASGNRGKVFRSTDSGATWSEITGAWNYEQANAIAISPAYAVDHTLFVGTTYGDPCSSLFKSQDGGDSWVLIPRAGWCKIGAIAIAPNYPISPTLLVGAESSLRHSEDDGATWNRVWSPGQFPSLAFSPAFATDHIGFATHSTLGLLKSVDGGANWMVLSSLTQQGNRVNGVTIRGGAHDNTIGGANSTPGGSCTGACNVISRNGEHGVSLSDAETYANVVSGNYIGTNAAGLQALGNGENGVAFVNGAHANTLGGNAPALRNVVSGNSNDGVRLYDPGTAHNVVIGNFIGTDATGTAALPNHSWAAIRLSNYAHDNRIGGVAAGEGNVVSGNDGSGIGMTDGVTGTLVVGNYIGVDATGLAPLGNGNQGIQIQGDSAKNIIGGEAAGAGNRIAYNLSAGITIEGDASLANTLTHNQIYSNTQTGIDLSNGGNAELAAPVLITVTHGNTVVGTACANCTVEVFSDAANQGRVFEGSVVTDGAGHFTFVAVTPLTGPNVTATATDGNGNTSEFSAPLALPPHGARIFLPVVTKM